MAQFGEMTLYDGGVNRAEAAENIIIGQVVAYDETQKAALANANDDELSRPIGVSLTNTEAGGLCVFATSPAIFDSGSLTSQDQDDRFYVSNVPGEVCKFDDLPDGAWLSIIAIPNISPDRFKLVLQRPDLKKSPCFLSSQDVPEAPSGLTAVSDEPYKVTLNWSAVTATCEVDNYTVYESVDDANYEAMQDVDGTTLSIESLGAGTTYFFKVAANNFNGQSALSDEATVVVQGPPAPFIGDITISGNDRPVLESTESYQASFNGTATEPIYQWVPSGGEIIGQNDGQVTIKWTSLGLGNLRVNVISQEEGITDSPAVKDLPITVES